jgi:hypothetical protein
MSRYGAFLSYSRRDLEFARKLHAALEAYRLPKNAGESSVTDKPDRISPIFRDQDEVSASPNLGDTLNQALADSSALIVIASPDSASSQWVNAEIDAFARLGRARRIFVAIPPYISEERGFQLNSIFPPALLKLGEPLAADFRKICDGWTLGKLKLVAGVAGVDLVRLRDRDAARRLQRTAIGSIAAAAVLGVVGVTGLNWWQADQRARTERIERSVEAIRANLLSDQVGLGLAYVDSIDRRSVPADIAAALDRIQLFWSDQLESPADAIAAIPIGSTYTINDVLYYRGEAGAMRMPVEGASSAFMRPGSSYMYMVGRDGVTHRVDAATGEATIPPGQAEGGFSGHSLYELPNGVLVWINTGGPGPSMAGASDFAHVSYGDGGSSGIINMRVHTPFHANADCTKLYFADGDEGYGAIPEIPVYNAKYVQILYEDATMLPQERFRLGVITLDHTAANWRETPMSPGQVTNYNAENFSYDWLEARGRPIEEACAQYKLEERIFSTEAANIRLPSLSQRAWRHDPSLARDAVWRREGGWSNGLVEYADGVPGSFADTPEGRFAVYEDLGAYMGAAYVFCNLLPGAAARCEGSEWGESEGALDYFPEANFVDTVAGLVDMRTLQVTPWGDEGGDHNGLTVAPGGRTLMSFADGTIFVYAYAPGQSPTLVRRFAHAETAEVEAMQALNAEDALIVTHEGRLMRVDTAEQRIEWSVRDREIAQSLGDNDYIGTPIGYVRLAASPDGTIGLVLPGATARLYELTIGAPLTPHVNFRGLGTQPPYRPVLTVTNDGAVTIAGARDGEAVVRDAPQRRPPPADPACLYGARVENGEVHAVEIFGDPQMMQRCGFTGATPVQN